MAMQQMGIEMQKQFAAGKQPDTDVIRKMKDVQKEFMASQQQVQKDADRAIFETTKQQQQLTEILAKSQLDIPGTMNGDTIKAKRSDFYSQFLRRQVLTTSQRSIAKIKGISKAADGLKKKSTTTERSPTSSSGRTQAS
jgi:hypothetical protein